ncbi:MAG: cytidylyltransferase [Bryobacterales bacterium]|nr:cytidylyltransferase [Bryobacterales bacterium]
MRIGLLPGTFNPPTRAHLALAEAARAHVDRVVFVLPRVLPHKDYNGVPFEARLEMLHAVATPPFDVMVTDGGLFVEIAREARAAVGGQVEITFLCGRDAAERIVAWDYGDAGAFARMLDEFEMLVASRNGDYEPPVGMQGRIRPLELGMECDHISATEVRERIARREAWEHLVPEAIRERVRELYG